MGCFSKNHFLENTNKKPANRLGGDRTLGRYWKKVKSWTEGGLEVD